MMEQLDQCGGTAEPAWWDSRSGLSALGPLGAADTLLASALCRSYKQKKKGGSPREPFPGSTLKHLIGGPSRCAISFSYKETTSQDYESMFSRGRESQLNHSNNSLFSIGKTPTTHRQKAE